MNSNRYREALDRIFDLAMQIDTIENRLKKEKRDDLQRLLEKLNNKKECGVKGKEKFSKELVELIAQAKSYGFIPMEDDLNLGIKHLQLLLETDNDVHSDGNFSRAEQIRSEIMSIRLKLSKINKFKSEYARYKKDTVETSDSLKPVNFLMSSDNFLVKGSFFEHILKSLQADIHTIRESIKNKTPIDIQILDLQNQYGEEINRLEEKLNLYPQKVDSPSSLSHKYRFLGTIEEKLKLYHNPDINIVDTIEKQITETAADIDNIKIVDNTEKRTLTIDLIQDFVKNYMNIVGGALDNYQHYMPYFDYAKKTLGLRKPQSTEVDYIGSSSNHMFLHLFFSLALHATAVVNKSPYVLPFLIIDQPSRPYYGNDSQGNQNEDYNSSDEGKILKAFKLLDSFMKNEPINNSFQMIVFEHIPEKLLTPDEFSSIHIVGDFFNDALVPFSELSQLEKANDTTKP